MFQPSHIDYGPQEHPEVKSLCIPNVTKMLTNKADLVGST